ncbi:hypothetical protein AM629_19425 [Photorhabdus heterorhabditis]|uniref:Uncharacterized protein n=1 Tax=Photorhabdus heterorhabditis TaxID=880156 RepID=A0ABR5K746_9GAMM|nr:hypothetical protein [Photorhabdus heterorhabditis]KOY60437.1 hypothetical protein AM629_19425 [Photorhabdus heterorhabditis]
MPKTDAYFDTLALIEKGEWDFGSMDEENEVRVIKAAKALVLRSWLISQPLRNINPISNGKLFPAYKKTCCLSCTGLLNVSSLQV